MARLRNLIAIPDLRKKVLFAILVVAIFRAGSFIPVPYVDFHAILALKKAASNGIGGAVGFLDLFSGGALTSAAVFALEIMPYITASIIVQLLGVVIPKLEEWQNEGQTGQKKITQWTRYLTVALALMQSTALVFVTESGNGGLLGVSGFTLPADTVLIHPFTAYRAGIIVLTWTAGTALVMWLAELITKSTHDAQLRELPQLGKSRRRWKRRRSGDLDVSTTAASDCSGGADVHAAVQLFAREVGWLVRGTPMSLRTRLLTRRRREEAGSRRPGERPVARLTHVRPQYMSLYS